MIHDSIEKFLFLYSDFGGNNWQDNFFVLFKESDDLFFDLKLAQVSKDEIFSIMYFWAAKGHFLIDFFAFHIDLFIIVFLVWFIL